MKKALIILGIGLLLQSQQTISASAVLAPNELESVSPTSTSRPLSDLFNIIFVGDEKVRSKRSILRKHTNPAIRMTEEERLAKYNEMKANDKFELVDGCFAKIHKVLPNLITFDYEQDVRNAETKNLGILRFTTLNGDVFTINWDEPYSTDEVYRHDKLKQLYNGKYWGNKPIDPQSDIWDMGYVYLSGGKWEPITVTCANGDVIKVKGNDAHKIHPWYVQIADKKQEGDYKGYLYYSDDKKEGYIIAGICKTLKECSIEIIGDLEQWNSEKPYRIIWPNGDVFEGTLKINGKYVNENRDTVKIKNDFDNYYNGLKQYSIKLEDDGRWQVYCAAAQWIERNLYFKGVGTLYNGMITCKDKSVKIYVNGEYDEIESITYTQRIQAEERKKKEAAAALVKQRATLTQKYGKQYVDIFYRPSAKMTDLIIVGMPVGLLMEFHDSGKLAIDIKMKQSNGTSTCYEICGYPALGGKYKKFGYFWAKNGRITSFNLYGLN